MFRRISIVFCVAISACSVEPVQPNLPDINNDWITSQGTQVDSQWWQHFADDQLDQWVQQGLQNNQDLQAAWYRLLQSRALWDASGADQFPSLDATVSRTSTESDDTSSQSWSARLSASYEIDFWGNIAAGKKQSEFNAMAQQAALRTLSNTVAGTIAESWYGWLVQEQTLALLNEQKRRIESSLAAVKGRYARGQVNVSDVWQQEQLLESINGSIEQTQATRAIYRQTLALWLSVPSQSLPESAAGQIPELRNPIQHVHSDAIQQRPDVLQAYFDLQSAQAGLAVAQSNRYPRFTLTASYTGESENINEVFDNWVTNFVAGLTAPLIDGGNRRALVRQNEAKVKEQIAHYKQVLLGAAQEVEQVLVNQTQQYKYLASLSKQLTLAKQTQGFQERRYRKGVGDFIEMLNAQTDVLDLEQSVLAAQWQLLQYRIELYRVISQGIEVKDMAEKMAKADLESQG